MERHATFQKDKIYKHKRTDNWTMVKKSFYARFDNTGQHKGFGFHTAQGKKKLERQGFKFVLSK